MPTVRTKTNNKKSPISVAFCFDHNMWMLAGVAIASLLRNAGARPYNIYCVVPADLPDAYRDELSRMVADMHKISSITFLNANSDFDSSVTHQYTVGIYYRFMLVKLLPHVDKIIYMDADTTACTDLSELFDMDMGKNLIAGVRDADQGRPWPTQPNGYINSGVLMMNLGEIRRSKMYDTWIKMSQMDCFAYPDQDILNKTCDGRIMYLPLKYNYMCGAGGRFAPAVAAGIYSAPEVATADKAPAIIHYILKQPWLGRANKMGRVWWFYAAMTPFYAAFLADVNQTPDVVEKRILLFNCIPVMRVKMYMNLSKYYLFGFIPLFKVKSA